MGKNFNLLWLILKLSFPLSIVLYPMVGLYGYIQPWAPAKPTLDSYPGQSSIMVGVSYRAQNKIETVSRSYILIPSVLSTQKIITVQQTNQESPVVSESTSGFFLFIGWVLASFVGTWWFWLRRDNKAPPNPSFKRDALKRAP